MKLLIFNMTKYPFLFVIVIDFYLFKHNAFKQRLIQINFNIPSRVVQIVDGNSP